MIIGPRWYKLLGKITVPCRSVEDWAAWSATHDNRVALTEIGPLTYAQGVLAGIDEKLKSGATE